MPEWVTTTRNRKARKQDFSSNFLPKTIRDAILYTSRLGIQFLWVDSLCILQDSADDWAWESVKMLEVFGNATVTLFADCAATDDDGFLKLREAGDFQIRRGICFDIEDRQGGIVPVQVVQRYSRYHAKPPAKALELFQNDVIGSHLSDRGWIFQEQVISGRRLHFGRHQIYWVCEQAFEAEDGTNLRHSSPYWLKWLFHPKRVEPSGRRIGHDEISESWAEHVSWAPLVENYTRRSLSRKTDKLLALAALAKAFGERFNDSYLIGCWKQCLRWNLLWSAKPTRGMSDEAVNESMAMLIDGTGGRPPSWSWLAADGAVEYPHLRTDKTTITEGSRLMHVYFQILDYPECIPGDVDTFGTLPIYCSPLRVRGVLEPAICLFPETEQGDETLLPPWYQGIEDLAGQYMPLYDDDLKVIGAMILDRLCEPPVLPVMLLKAWESVGMCPCCLTEKSRYSCFIVLEEAEAELEGAGGGGQGNVFRRIGSGWSTSRQAPNDGHLTQHAWYETTESRWRGESTMFYLI